MLLCVPFFAVKTQNLAKWECAARGEGLRRVMWGPRGRVKEGNVGSAGKG